LRFRQNGLTRKPIKLTRSSPPASHYRHSLACGGDKRCSLHPRHDHHLRSKILEHYVPPYDATAVTRLEEAGAVILGKTNCDEFAMGSSNENSAYGVVENPVALDRVPGGSAAVAAAVARGSRRVARYGHGGSSASPERFAAYPAMMAATGRVSRYGLIAFRSSLDRIGPSPTIVKERCRDSANHCRA